MKTNALSVVLPALFLTASLGLGASTSDRPAAAATDAEGLYVSDSMRAEVTTETVEGAGKAEVGERSSGHQTQALDLLGELARKYPATFTSAGVQAPGSDQYYVNFTQQPGSEVFALLGAQPFDTNVAWGFNANAMQLEDATDRLAAALDRDPRVKALRVGGVAAQDSLGVEVRLEIASPDQFDAQELVNDGIQEVNSTARSELPEVPVVVGENEAPVSFVPQADVKGGHAATSCGRTTGFTASWNGNLGVITAAHGSCSSLNVYDSASGVISSFSTPKRPAVGGGSLDVWFATTQAGHTTSKKFASANNIEVTVTGVGTPVQNMLICKYGLATGRNCGDLFINSSASFCATATGDGVLYCRLYQASRVVTAEGDSGGPWFWDSGAYGITSGADGFASILTAASAIETAGIPIRQN